MTEEPSITEIVAHFIRDYVAGRALVNFYKDRDLIEIVDEEMEIHQYKIILFALDPAGECFSAGFWRRREEEVSPSLHDPDFDLLPWVAQQLTRLVFLPPSPDFDVDNWPDRK